MSWLRRLTLLLISLLVLGFIAFYLFLVARDPQNIEEDFSAVEAPAIALLNSRQNRIFTLGREIRLGGYEITAVSDGIEFDHAIFDFDLNDNILTMTYNINPNRTPSTPSGTLPDGTFDRYYLRFKGYNITNAIADPTAPLVPTVVWDGRTLLIEIGEGMVLSEGANARIVLETADSDANNLDTIFIPAVEGD